MGYPCWRNCAYACACACGPVFSPQRSMASGPHPVRPAHHELAVPVVVARCVPSQASRGHVFDLPLAPLPLLVLFPAATPLVLARVWAIVPCQHARGGSQAVTQRSAFMEERSLTPDATRVCGVVACGVLVEPTVFFNTTDHSLRAPRKCALQCVCVCELKEEQQPIFSTSDAQLHASHRRARRRPATQCSGW